MGFEKVSVIDHLFEEDVHKLTFDKAVTIANNKEAVRQNYNLFPISEIKSESAELHRVADRASLAKAGNARKADQGQSRNGESNISKESTHPFPCKVCV